MKSNSSLGILLRDITKKGVNTNVPLFRFLIIYFSDIEGSQTVFKMATNYKTVC